MEVDVTYISSSCGRTPNAVDCGSGNSVAFSSRNSLAIFQTDINGHTEIKNTFAGHKDRVNAVKWIRTASGQFDDGIITGSADNTAIVWQKSGESFIKSHHLVGHSGTVNAVDGVSASVLYAATASVDSTVKIWKIDENGDQKVQTIPLGNGICLSLQLFVLPNTVDPILACGLHDSNIHIYGENINNLYEPEYTKLLVLSGHEDWVRGLDFVQINPHKVMLASCSQDTYIRLWGIDYFVCDKSAYKIRVEKSKFSVSNTIWSVSLEAVLSGHESAVYGVHWNIQKENDDAYRLKLLSSSIDKSLIIWESDKQNGVWVESVRVGEVGGGGLGFYGGKFIDGGNRILGHGYLGSFHIWKYVQESDRWEPDVPCGGHFDEVMDLAWDPDGEYVMTVSLDKTTRIHAPWVRETGRVTWHELARPQVHGYEMSCLAVLSRYRFASGAEEKVIRTFEAPHNFIENFHTISGVPMVEIDRVEALAEGASVPSLGLSNKAVYSNEQQTVDINEKSLNKQYTENRFIATKLEVPPTEETLIQNTLWPEQHKLYGHGYEVFALAAIKDGTLLASACKATKPHHAAIIIWSTKTWVQIQTLLSHNLTVTQMSFSPDGFRLLSVSRDRKWSVFRRDSFGSEFQLEASTDKTNGVHSRIIWCCAWTHDSEHFATGSRDGKVAVWTKNDGRSWSDFSPLTPILNLPEESVTAVGFAPCKTATGKYLMAAGFESGIVSVYGLDKEASENRWCLYRKLDNSIAHHLTVKRLSFRPSVVEAGTDLKSSKLQLASVSSDNSCKIYTLSIDALSE